MGLEIEELQQKIEAINVLFGMVLLTTGEVTIDREQVVTAFEQQLAVEVITNDNDTITVRLVDDVSF